MRVATVDGLVTLYYDGSKKLYNQELHQEWFRVRRQNTAREWWGHADEGTDVEAMDVSDECKRYMRERLSWQQIIILEGVTEIPVGTFFQCFDITRVIFANTVIRIQRGAFKCCNSLVYIKLSLSLEYIGEIAFEDCNLSSVFVPPRCREIRNKAFARNEDLSILNVPQDAELGSQIINNTALAEASPVNGPTNDSYDLARDDEINEWLKNINNDENFALHRACTSFNPLKQVILAIVQAKGLKVFREKNSIGITPSRYLKENPYTEITEKQIIHDYLMKMTGDIV